MSYSEETVIKHSMYAILSDIHGNFYALENVVRDMNRYSVEGIILLGDLIDYGMQSNEVVRFIRDEWKDKIICNIWGNHERAIIEQDFTRFSSQRGIDCAKYTSRVLEDDVISYLKEELVNEGVYEFHLKGNHFLSVHGSLDDNYWKAVMPDAIGGEYVNYDIVLSGHSHNSQMFTKFYESGDLNRRNKHAVLFINPGSVGQPRNHNPNAQYVLFDIDSKEVVFRTVKYDVNAAMKLYDGSVDLFYRDRLKYGV